MASLSHQLVALLLASAATSAVTKPLRNNLVGFLPRLEGLTIDLTAEGKPGVANTTLHWYDQTIDHFSWAPAPTGAQVFKQRYFVYDAHWSPGGPIFFYCGNEANVELYVNATGLMWENAKDFGAALVFAEHRYYGESMPFGKSSNKYMHYLTMEQALADYATFIPSLKRAWKSEGSPVVAFGGSYGGMLAAWLRMKYPGVVDGSIAASAPILAFHNEKSKFGGGETFWQVVTRDATAAAGSAPSCANNVGRAWRHIFDLGKTTEGKERLARIFRLCKKTPVETAADVENLALMILNAWDSMAMGNYPYPSNYLVYQQTHDPSILLPAFPVRVACSHLKTMPGNPEDLLSALRDAVGVFYNASSVQCFELPDDPNFDGIWDYQWCTEMLPQETYFTRDGVHDMFWPSLENMTAINEHCEAKYGVRPRDDWIANEFSGTAGASNIVFSNGLYDPWSAGGVLKDVSDTAVAVVIPEGAHHLDLMFSNPLDPPSVTQARQTELAHIRRWIAAKASIIV